MKILVTAASKHGGTAAIAEAICRVLCDAGLDAENKPVDSVTSVADYDAVVMGSAVYVGRWLSAATRFVQTHADELSRRPLWLFSSGPIGAPEAKPIGDPESIPELVEQVNARAHRVFKGRIDRGLLSFGEKLAVRAVRAPEGDYREWAAIESWARGIADQLLPARATVGTLGR